MACILAGDLLGAERLLVSLRIITGTPMEINILTLQAISSALQGSDPTSTIGLLRNAILQMPEFNYNIAPIRFLEAGLLASKSELPRSISDILEIPKNPIAPHLNG
jgi:hypothetical protein